MYGEVATQTQEEQTADGAWHMLLAETRDCQLVSLSRLEAHADTLPPNVAEALRKKYSLICSE